MIFRTIAGMISLGARTRTIVVRLCCPNIIGIFLEAGRFSLENAISLSNGSRIPRSPLVTDDIGARCRRTLALDCVPLRSVPLRSVPTRTSVLFRHVNGWKLSKIAGRSFCVCVCARAREREGGMAIITFRKKLWLQIVARLRRRINCSHRRFIMDIRGRSFVLLRPYNICHVSP